VPARSDTDLVTSTAYGDDGLPSLATDPRGIQNLTTYDLLGQATSTIAAYTGAAPTSDTDQTTLYTYDGDGNETSMTAVMPSGTPSQTTDYIYGVAGGTSGIFSNDLLAKVEYPDATTGAASTAASDDTTTAYDALGEPVTMSDQNGTTHTDSYDPLGRETLDSVTTLGSGVDGSVRAIGTSYNSQGLPYQLTSYSDAAATTIVNQEQHVYNGLGQLTGEYQSVSGAVNTSTTPEVQYAFSDPSLGSRLTSMTYPNGRVLDDVYNSGIDTTIGRVSALADAGGSAAGTDQGYTYQGVDTIVGNTDGNGVAETTTLDNFGRTAEMNYVNTATSVSTDDFQYGYDRDGNVLYKNNILNSSESELYHANSVTSGDNNAAYDPLNRLTGFERGTLSSSGNNGSTLDTVVFASASQFWNLNAVGDQSSVTTNGTTTTNATNAKNELTTNGSSSLTFDSNGNETTDENGQTTTYDAWNRAITVKNTAGATIASYSYDPQNRRITEASGGTTTDIYFTNQWQDIEERQGGTVTRQNVWGLGYVNQLVERDDNSTSGNLGITGSGLGERLYAQQDANWNVTALVDASGNVEERMVYSPYGAVTFLTPSWTPTSDAYAQNVLFQGGRFEAPTGNYLFDNRDYEPNTGTWDEQDPKGYVDGANRYQPECSNPTTFLDALGLDVFLYFWGTWQTSSGAGHVGIGIGTDQSQTFYEAYPDPTGDNVPMGSPFEQAGSIEQVKKTSHSGRAGRMPDLILKIPTCLVHDDPKAIKTLNDWFANTPKWSAEKRTDCADAAIAGLNAEGVKIPELKGLYTTPQALSKYIHGKPKHDRATVVLGNWDSYDNETPATVVLPLKVAGGAVVAVAGGIGKFLSGVGNILSDLGRFVTGH
jgi:RHS repeat-associated protein